MSRRIWLALLLLASFQCAHAEEASSRLRISLLTCSPGKDLYAVFGHSALRIVDSAVGTDIVYNYGTFDFDDPDFYTKFVRGKLRYFLSQANFADFMYEYAYFKRPVKEQVLNLTGQEKIALQQAIFENLREENRYYQYDFLFDNCTTRLRDLIFKTQTASAFLPPPLVEKGTTFRDHLHVYLDKADMPWTKLGIDILLGAGSDRIMNVEESMFLPDPLMLGVKLAVRQGRQLESESSVLVDFPVQREDALYPSWTIPALVFAGFALIVLFLSFRNTISSKKWLNWLDLFIFGLSGLLGLLLLFTWFGTDHGSFRYNLNLIWACPLNILFFYGNAKKTGWFRKWLKINSILILLLAGAYLVWPGIINPLLFPVIIVLSFRSWLLSR